MAVEIPPGAVSEPEAIPPPPSEPPALLSPSPPPAASPYPPPYPLPSAPRRRRSLLWYTTMLIAVVVTLGAFGLLFIDDQSWQRQANQLKQQNDSLQEQLVTAQTNNSDLQQQLQAAQAEMKHPKLELWNVDERIDDPDHYLAGGVPDTFTYHLDATSSGPMNVSVVTFEQFVAGIECVDQGRGNTNYCLHHSGTTKSFLLVRSVAYDFHLAEGCAGYMVVFTAPSAVTVHPDVSVTYNPAPTFTGDC